MADLYFSMPEKYCTFSQLTFNVHHPPQFIAILHLRAVSFAISKSITNMNIYIYEHNPHMSHAYPLIHYVVFRGPEEAFTSSKNCLPLFVAKD
jgi:hypothetical protein